MSSTTLSPRPAEPGVPGIPRWLTLMIAAVCGLIVANIYYPQPLIAPISESLGLSPQAAGLIVTMTQLGYGAGLLLIVPMGDLFENRRLVLAIVGLSILALAGAAAATSALPFLLAALGIGVASVSVQVLVPYAAHLAPDAVRGRVVGTIMSGLMLGIMLARPVASLITHFVSWRAVFVMSAVVMAGVAAVLRPAMPERRPAPGLRYGALLRSMLGLARTTPVLQRRALYHSFLFGAFSLFWTTAPLVLADQFHLTQFGIAVFAFAGVAGAVSAPIAGRVADRGWTGPATAGAMGIVAASFLLSHVSGSGSGLALGALTCAAILLDFGVTAHLVLGQRAIFSLPGQFRSRLNGLFMATFFMGGAVGSAAGGWAYAHGGWGLTTWLGLALPVAALACFAFERVQPR